MRTNANREDHEDRELSVQELETVSGGSLGMVGQDLETYPHLHFEFRSGR